MNKIRLWRKGFLNNYYIIDYNNDIFRGLFGNHIEFDEIAILIQWCIKRNGMH